MGTTSSAAKAPRRPLPATYWRRRFVVLVIALSMLAVVTWAISGAFGGAVPAAGAASKHAHDKQPHPAITASTVRTSVAATSSAGTRPRPTSSAAGSPRGARGPAAATGSARLCPVDDVVLSVFSGQTSYSIRQEPEFQVDVVSTSWRSCTFNIGAQHVWLEVRHGSTLVWSSKECAEGQASLLTVLRRGVPTVLTIGWNGAESTAGCPGVQHAAGRGSYSAIASDGSTSSVALHFRIS